jgi:hypothetical protein
MRLEELPRWLTVLGPLLEGGVLKSANPFQLGDIVLLDIELDGSHHLKLLEIGRSRIEKVLALLNAHIGWTLKDISKLEIGD